MLPYLYFKDIREAHRTRGELLFFDSKNKIKIKYMKKSFLVDEKGFYGDFGGSYVPEILYATVEKLRE